MEDDKTKLIFLVQKPIWLAVQEEPKFKITGWTSKKPLSNNGFIGVGTWLIFDYIFTSPEGEGLNFMQIKPGTKSEFFAAEFTENDIEHLTEEGALILQDGDDIDEMTITPKGILVKDFEKLTYNRPIIQPKDMYIIMGIEEMKHSGAKIKYGEKISLKHLLDIYSTAVGQNLILK